MTIHYSTGRPPPESSPTSGPGKINPATPDRSPKGGEDWCQHTPLRPPSQPRAVNCATEGCKATFYPGGVASGKHASREHERCACGWVGLYHSMHISQRRKRWLDVTKCSLLAKPKELAARCARCQTPIYYGDKAVMRHTGDTFEETPVVQFFCLPCAERPR